MDENNSCFVYTNFLYFYWIVYQYPFDLSMIQAAHISFWTRYFIQAEHDFGYVEVSTDGGYSWQQRGAVYTGVQGQWKEEQRSLTAFCGAGFDDVRIRFRLVSDSTTIFLGWFIDNVSIYPDEITATTNWTGTQIPEEFELYNNYPNPFNAKTKISYSIPQSGIVVLKIYNMLGREIHTLVNEFQPEGKYSFDFDARELSSGVYFYQLKVGNRFSETRKMLYIK